MLSEPPLKRFKIVPSLAIRSDSRLMLLQDSDTAIDMDRAKDDNALTGDESESLHDHHMPADAFNFTSSDEQPDSPLMSEAEASSTDEDDDDSPPRPRRSSEHDSEDSDDTRSDNNGNENDGEEPIDVENDLMYKPWSSLAHDALTATEIDLMMDKATSLPPAFEEASAIRNHYIRAYLHHVSDGMTHQGVKNYLDGQHASLSTLVQQTPHLNITGLDNMARTLPTIERRLGLSTAPYLTYYIVCPECWLIFPPSDLYDWAGPSCTSVRCSGQLYSIKRAVNGSEVRTPSKIMPVANLVVVLRRIMLRPGKFDQMQHWRRSGDEPGLAEPVGEAEHRKHHPSSEQMCDITDGWGWREIEAGLERHTLPSGQVKDISSLSWNQRFVSLPCGLVFILNLDWYFCLLLV